MTADQLRAMLDEAIARRDALVPTNSGDPALARLAGRALTQHHRRTDTALAAYVAADQKVADLTGRLYRAQAREQEAARERLTQADFVGAVAVRDALGWHRVIRVNKTTVTVETPWSWTDRIKITDIREVKR